MAKRKSAEYDEFDDLEYSYESDEEGDSIDDTTRDGPAASECGLAAWQRIERRQESQWLRSQVVDWDDWDE